METVKLEIRHSARHKPYLVAVAGNDAVKLATFEDEAEASMFHEFMQMLADKIYQEGYNDGSNRE